MNWLTQTLNSSLGKKLLMALTGLFLILFLVGHLLGNMQLFLNDEGRAFNEYARFMTTNPIVRALSILTYASILGHVVYSLLLTIHNRKARPIRYAATNANQNSKWNSRNMGILGTVILIFLVIHLKTFWYTMHFGPIQKIDYGGAEIKDLYSVVVAAFSQLWYVALYVVCMGILGLHLAHGFKSAFQTLGLIHVKYTPFLSLVGLTFSIVVPALFASIPLYMYLKSINII